MENAYEMRIKLISNQRPPKKKPPKHDWNCLRNEEITTRRATFSYIFLFFFSPGSDFDYIGTLSTLLGILEF